ncbi:MAG: hypothetical protein H6721_27660 [Sandaracinus sp.]|nr:hypothetical protein [Sandaracinus sp.]MCB9635912.1 hypothetical protein [Sandaracinus sp.]
MKSSLHTYRVVRAQEASQEAALHACVGSVWAGVAVEAGVVLKAGRRLDSRTGDLSGSILEAVVSLSLAARSEAVSNENMSGFGDIRQGSSTPAMDTFAPFGILPAFHKPQGCLVGSPIG